MHFNVKAHCNVKVNLNSGDCEMELALYVSRCSEVLVRSVTFTLHISTDAICCQIEEQRSFTDL